MTIDYTYRGVDVITSSDLDDVIDRLLAAEGRLRAALDGRVIEDSEPPPAPLTTEGVDFDAIVKDMELEAHSWSEPYGRILLRYVRLLRAALHLTG